MENFSSNFKSFRNSFGYTQEYLGELLSVETGTIARYESGKLQPSIPVIKKIGKIYGISLDFFIHNGLCSYPRNLKLLNLAKKLDDVSYSDARSSIESVIKTLLKDDFSRELNIQQDKIDIELTNSFYKNLKEIRSSKKISQPQFAKILKISRSLVAQYELSSYPPIERLSDISKYLGISIHALLTGEKLLFDFEDKFFGRIFLSADQRLSIDDQKVLIRLLEATFEK